MIKKYRKPHRVKKKKPIIRNRFFWLGILSLIILGGIFYFFFLSNIFQVEKIIVTGEQKVSRDDIKSVVESNLEKKILFFKTQSIFLVNTQNIKEDILKKFPQIAEIEITRGFPDSLSILLVERFGLAIWCQGEECFLLDNEGVIFETVPDTEPNLFKIKNLAQIPDLKLGINVIEKEKLNQILQIESKLKADLKIPLEEALIVSDERVNFKTLEGWEIYFNPKGDLNWQLTKLKAVLEEEISPERRKNLEYIELRFGNFANPKYKD